MSTLSTLSTLSTQVSNSFYSLSFLKEASDFRLQDTHPTSNCNVKPKIDGYLEDVKIITIIIF